MNFKHFIFLIGLTAAMGLIRVSQKEAIWLSSYRIGENQKNIHQLESENLWLMSQVDYMRSPFQLAATVKKNKSELVAWSSLKSAKEDHLMIAQSSD
jgi:hypothetical protein